MADKNVLVIAYYFPPMGLSGVQRTLKFVKYLSNFGWNPIVLTHTPRSFYAYDDKLLEELDGLDIKIYRTEPGSTGSESKKAPKLTKFPNYTVQKIGRAFLQTIYQPDSKIRWKKPAIELARKIIEENHIDTIFATAPPFTDFLIAQEISKEFNIPFVVDYRDVWIDNPFHFYATPFHKLYSIQLETEILTYAKKAIVTNRYAKELLLKRYGFINHDDVVIIPHGYDNEDFEPYKSIRPDRNKFTITHSGLFQDNRTPKYFFKALSQFIAENPSTASKIKANFLGLMRPGHERMIKKYKLTEIVECSGYLSHTEAIAELKKSDILWLMLDDTVRSPGKLYEYFGAEKPILACLPDGAMKKLALDTKASIVTEPKDVKAIKSAIARFYELWQNNILPTPDLDYVHSFDRKLLTKQLSRELSNSMDI